MGRVRKFSLPPVAREPDKHRTPPPHWRGSWRCAALGSTGGESDLGRALHIAVAFSITQRNIAKDHVFAVDFLFLRDHPATGQREIVRHSSAEICREVFEGTG